MPQSSVARDPHARSVPKLAPVNSTFLVSLGLDALPRSAAKCQYRSRFSL